MDYRWIGAVLILSGCTGCGYSIAAGKRREERLLWQLQRILEFMESELEYHITPLPELCLLAVRQERGLLRTVFRSVHRELTTQKLPDAGSCMYAAVRQSGEVPARVRRLLVQLGATLGCFDLPGQLQGIRGVRKNCESALAGLQKNREERLRSYQTLGICAGAALAVLLL